ncbi:MAG: hypothetical protein IJX45_02405 [Spirochaetaceae bacterium]|nr:hypothetical protein [Spirochaetaceae bacterium]MBQ8562122.1 hypothetical protein [Spirochaetaceae bacterium]
MTEKEKRAFEFAKEQLGQYIGKVKQISDNWKGYIVYAPIWTKIFVAGMPIVILEKGNTFSIKQDYECLELISILPDD